ncbi:MAG: hypothetical protein HC800_14700 [Phormidesmis sp. RL_2_1]|nr:hypothetical protein [Phormidesmis sp. RL_2_1]
MIIGLIIGCFCAPVISLLRGEFFGVANGAVNTAALEPALEPASGERGPLSGTSKRQLRGSHWFVGSAIAKIEPWACFKKRL